MAWWKRCFLSLQSSTTSSINPLLMPFFPSSSLSLSPTISHATLSLCAAHCPPGRTLHKLTRDSNSFSSNLNCLPLPSHDWILTLCCKTNKSHTQSKKNGHGWEMRASRVHFAGRCWESESPTWRQDSIELF